MASRFVSTSRLGNIIQMISLSRQSGILRVIRGHGSGREMGQIQFLDGEATSALLGSLTGQNAMSVLYNWGECAYSFEESASGSGTETENGFPWSDSMPSAGDRSPSQSSSLSGSWPSYGYSQSGASPAAPLSSPLPGEPYYSSSSGYGSQPGYVPPAQGTTGNLPDLDGYHGPRTAPARISSPAITHAVPNPGISPEVLLAVPVRTALSEHIDRLPLDRRERMVLMLVDGQRRLDDLVRLTRRNEHEVYAVLSHLNVLGLVVFRR